MNIYTLYFGGSHVLSIIFAAFSVLLGFWLLRGRYHPIYILMMSLSVTQFGTFAYDLIWHLVRGAADLGMILLCINISAGIMLIVLAMNHFFKFDFININRWTVILTAVFIADLFLMVQTGWFIEVNLWIAGSAPDPHNLLWAISKFLGFLIPVSVLKKKSNGNV